MGLGEPGLHGKPRPCFLVPDKRQFQRRNLQPREALGSQFGTAEKCYEQHA
jgi:hypothetical protein